MNRPPEVVEPSMKNGSTSTQRMTPANGYLRNTIVAGMMQASGIRKMNIPRAIR
jgi:hypothetical protein